MPRKALDRNDDVLFKACKIPFPREERPNNRGLAIPKSSKFSDSFNNMMFQDNSLWAASRLQVRLNDGNKLREAKREREKTKLQSVLDRRALAAHYRDNYGIRVDSNIVERLTEK